MIPETIISWDNLKTEFDFFQIQLPLTAPGFCCPDCSLLLGRERTSEFFECLWFTSSSLEFFSCDSFSQLPWDVGSVEFFIFKEKRPFCPGSKVLLALLPDCFSFSKLSCLEWTTSTTHFLWWRFVWLLFVTIFLACSLSPENTEVGPRWLKQNMTYLEQNSAQLQALIFFW